MANGLLLPMHCGRAFKSCVFNVFWLWRKFRGLNEAQRRRSGHKRRWSIMDVNMISPILILSCHQVDIPYQRRRITSSHQLQVAHDNFHKTALIRTIVAISSSEARAHLYVLQSHQY